jgi:hypothetical protein
VRERSHRLIASRWPTVGVFDDIAADEEELRVAFLLEALTNDRLQLPRRRLELIPEGEVVSGGGGSSIVMAAFLHADEQGGRFSDHRLGAWYASLDLDTAIAETLHHNERRLRASPGVLPAVIQMRELVSDLDLLLLNVRDATRWADLYDPDDYTRSQAFAAEHRWPFAPSGEDGLTFASVRRKGGRNVCLWRPRAVVLPVLQGGHYEYRWAEDWTREVVALAT